MVEELVDRVVRVEDPDDLVVVLVAVAGELVEGVVLLVEVLVWASVDVDEDVVGVVWKKNNTFNKQGNIKSLSMIICKAKALKSKLNLLRSILNTDY